MESITQNECKSEIKEIKEKKNHLIGVIYFLLVIIAYIIGFYTGYDFGCKKTSKIIWNEVYENTITYNTYNGFLSNKLENVEIVKKSE